MQKHRLGLMPLSAMARMPLVKWVVESFSALERVLSNDINWRGKLIRAASLALTFLAYAGVLNLNIPKEIGLPIRNGFSLLGVGLVFALLYFVYSRSGWVGEMVSLAITLILFALPLSGLWNSGYSDGEIIGGLLPFSDASGYYTDAYSLIDGNFMSPFSARRPWFASTLAVFLWLTGGDLAVALALFGAIAASACFLLSREIQRSHGTIAGVTVIVFLFLFYKYYIGIALSENLGIAFGAIALTVLWFGARKQKMVTIWLGMFLLTIALTARAGAFFVLPALVLWGTFFFRDRSRFSRRFLIGGTSAIILGFLLDSVLRGIIAVPGSVPFGNFSWSLYGLAVGNKGWLQVLQDHPEINQVAEPGLSILIYQLAFDAIRANPLRMVEGLLGAGLDYFNPVTTGAFTFIRLWHTPVEVILTRVALYLLSGLAFVKGLEQRRDSNFSLILAATIGVLLSVPLVPPIDADRMRAYAATIPISAVLVGLGLATVLQGFKSQDSLRVSDNVDSTMSSVSFGIMLVAFCFIAPITLRVLSHVPQFDWTPCPSGLETLYVRPSSKSLVNLVPDTAQSQSHLPNIRISDFKSTLNLGIYPDLAQELEQLGVNTIILQSMNREPGMYYSVWLVGDSSIIPATRSWLRICARPTENKWLKNYNFFYAVSAEPVSERAR